MRRFAITAVLGTLAFSLATGAAVAAGDTAHAAPTIPARPTAPAAPAAYPGDAGRIAFVSKGDIFTVEPNGAGLLRLTSDGHASGPRWSPDGTKIAYIDAGDLWVMNANGSHKIRLTDTAPAATDARPTWSSNGQYLVFVKTARRASYGYLTRYNMVTKGQVTYTDTINGHLIKVAALPAPVAWTHASDGGYYIAFEGAAAQCPAPLRYCLDLLGLTSQSEYVNGFPSSEDSHDTAVRFTDPDWYPIRTLYYLDIIVTSENCPAGHCTVTGTQFRIYKLVLPGSYEAVFAPTGHAIAYVKNTRGTPWIYTMHSTIEGPYGTSTPIVKGTEPDWQPL
jgi:dipeptidyl aminopeptidase/acylaminoacyl peptidase